MTDYYSVGRDIEFGFVKETAYNEAWGSPTLDGIYISPDFDLSPNLDKIEEPHVPSDPIMSLNEIATGNKSYTLRVMGKMPKEGFGWLFLALFGKVNTSANGDFYLHLFDPTTLSPCSLKLVLKTPIKNRTDTEWRLRGAKVKSLEFSFEVNQPIKFTIEFEGGGWDIATIASNVTIPSPPDGSNPFLYFNSGTGAFIRMGSTGDIGWHSATLRFENTLASDVADSYKIGSNERIRLERAGSEHCLKVTATGKRLFTQKGLIEYYRDFTDSLLETHFDIGINDYRFYFDCNNAKLLTHKIIPKGEGLMHEEINVQGFTDTNQMLYEDTQSEPATQEGA